MNELMEHFDFWYTNIDLKKKETEAACTVYEVFQAMTDGQNK